MSRDIYIGMQPDEDEAVATCGCALYRAGMDVPNTIGGAGWNDDPAFVMCAKHEAADRMLRALKVFTADSMLRGFLQRYDPKALEQAERAIAKAETT